MKFEQIAFVSFEGIYFNKKVYSPKMK